MFSSDFTSHTALALAERFRAHPADMVSYLERLFLHIEKSNPSLNAVVTIEQNAAMNRATQLSLRAAKSEEVLFGVPVIIKENIQKKGYSVSCASHILKNYRGQFNATAVTSLERAGAIIVATANMDEFAMGSSNEHSIFGAVKNPHDVSRVSGGSSGGSAVACAMGYAPLTLGSDTGGSVRQPAAYCGIFGFKPSYGRVSRYGLVAYGSSLDQIAPFARSARDLNILMKVIGHECSYDATTLKGQFESAPISAIQGKKIGVLRGLLSEGLADNVSKSFSEFEKFLKVQGATIVDIDIKSLEHTLSVYYLIACAEASSNLARFDGIRYGHRANKATDLNDLYAQSRTEGFGDEVKLRIMLGTFALSSGYYDAYYGRAQAVRALMAEEFAKTFETVDFVLTPTAPTSAFKLGENLTDPVQMYLNDIFTIPANLTGMCAISLPARVDEGALPVGVQLMAAKGNDALLLAFAEALEQAGLVAVTKLT